MGPAVRTGEAVTVPGVDADRVTAAVEREEAVEAWEDGADELDVVLNVGRVKAGETDAVIDELGELVATVPVPVKVIVEAPLLTETEMRRAAEAAVEADADYLKTGTGFAGPATVEDVALLAEYLPVKASGGIGTYEAARAMLDAGADRIGASAGVELVDRRDDFVLPFGLYRAIPKSLAKGFRGVDDAVRSVGGDRLSSVTYWMVEK